MNAMQAAAGKVDRWISLGDSVGLFPQINKVLDTQRGLAVIAVRGDHEANLLSGGTIKGSFTGSQALERQRQVISADNYSYLASLKDSRDEELGGLKLRFTHYLTPNQGNEECKYHIDQAQLDQLYAGYDFVFCGHTHLPMILYCKNVIVINPGSAGFPVDSVRQPSMLKLDTERRTFELVRFKFDISPLLESIRAERYNIKLVQYLENGNKWS